MLIKCMVPLTSAVDQFKSPYLLTSRYPPQNSYYRFVLQQVVSDLYYGDIMSSKSKHVFGRWPMKLILSYDNDEDSNIISIVRINSRS